MSSWPNLTVHVIITYMIKIKCYNNFMTTEIVQLQTQDPNQMN
jgi:hypothetical protein